MIQPMCLRLIFRQDLGWKYKVFQLEKAPGNDFYSAYALTNFQEFWAESVELFFERSAQLQTAYPDLYKTIAAILNQDPLH